MALKRTRHKLLTFSLTLDFRYLTFFNLIYSILRVQTKSHFVISWNSPGCDAGLHTLVLCNTQYSWDSIASLVLPLQIYPE